MELSDRRWVGIISMPTWAFWNKPFDWKTWLQTTFAGLRSSHTSALVIDLRRNEGGDGAIGEMLMTLLCSLPSHYESHVPRLVYEVVPERLRPHLSTWDRSFYDQRIKEEPLAPNAFTLKEREPPIVNITPAPLAYAGPVYVLVGPNDSSATFEFARIVKETRIATLVGQPTGGNRRGINGGNMFFLTLPNTGITIDLPVISWMARGYQPDAPVMPDLMVSLDFDAIASGTDPDLLAVRAALRRYDKRQHVPAG